MLFACRLPPAALRSLRLSLCLGMAAPAVRAAEPVTVERRLAAMGTLLTMRVAGPDRPCALAASEAAAREIARVEDLLSTWKRGGPLDRLNRARPGEEIALGVEAAAALSGAFAWSQRTGGAFDPTVLPLVRAWDLRAQGRVPGEAELARALAATGWERFLLHVDKGVARRLSADAGIDEGAWGKGYALDRAAAALRQAGVREALVDLGGQVLALGHAAVSIADPRDRGRPAASLDVADGSVSTSGNSERSLAVAGRRIGHLLDPRTGLPAPDFGSATAVAPSGLAADVLSTAFFVLGPEKGLALSETLRREGFANEALFLVVQGDRVRALASPGLRFRLEEAPPILEQRIERLEKLLAETRAELEAAGAVPAGDAARLAEIERQIEILAREVEQLKLGEAAPAAAEITDLRYGVGPAASKVYGKKGVSIGGYGEFLYENFAGLRQDGEPSGQRSHADLLRAVLYFGYKFDDRWVLNTELEAEHAVTASDKGGEVAVEFAYLDYMAAKSLRARAGLVLIPMGLVNELHEPPTVLGARRPEVEQALIPSTWREIGAGFYGDAGRFSYRLYAVNGLNSEGYGAEGIREGSQEGSEALAVNWAATGRLDWTPAAGALVGASFFTGDSGQGRRTPAGRSFSGRTTLFDVHADWKWRGLWLRGLYVHTAIGDASAINEANGLEGNESVGSRQWGWYVQGGFDVLSLKPGARASLTPFVRYERYDTQAQVPARYARNPENDVKLLTVGAVFKPIDPIAIKVDWQQKTNAASTGVNQWNVGLGYLF
jgi:thiamine biosynthesis lipoprotein ApbE